MSKKGKNNKSPKKTEPVKVETPVENIPSRDPRRHPDDKRTDIEVAAGNFGKYLDESKFDNTGAYIYKGQTYHTSGINATRSAIARQKQARKDEKAKNDYDTTWQPEPLIFDPENPIYIGNPDVKLYGEGYANASIMQGVIANQDVDSTTKVAMAALAASFTTGNANVAAVSEFYNTMQKEGFDLGKMIKGENGGMSKLKDTFYAVKALSNEKREGSTFDFTKKAAAMGAFIDKDSKQYIVEEFKKATGGEGITMENDQFKINKDVIFQMNRFENNFLNPQAQLKSDEVGEAIWKGTQTADKDSAIAQVQGEGFNKAPTPYKIFEKGETRIQREKALENQKELGTEALGAAQSQFNEVNKQYQAAQYQLFKMGNDKVAQEQYKSTDEYKKLSEAYETTGKQLKNVKSAVLGKEKQEKEYEAQEEKKKGQANAAVDMLKGFSAGAKAASRFERKV